MANNNKNNKQQQRKNWFTTKRDQFGDNWIDRVSIMEIQNNVLRILTDMSRGNFDYNSRDMVDFCDQRVITKIKAYVDTRYAEFLEIVSGLNLAMTHGTTSSDNTIYVYNIAVNILNTYTQLRENIYAYCYSGDPTVVINIVQLLSNPKNRNYIDLNRAFSSSQ